jgi:hypothetical protein
MANMPHQFKNRDITRCLRAAHAAGVRSPTIEVHLPGGTRYVVGGEVMPEQRGAALGKTKARDGSSVPAGRSPSRASAGPGRAARSGPSRTR